MNVVMKHVSGTAKANLEHAEEEMTRVLAYLSQSLENQSTRRANLDTLVG